MKRTFAAMTAVSATLLMLQGCASHGQSEDTDQWDSGSSPSRTVPPNQTRGGMNTSEQGPATNQPWPNNTNHTAPEGQHQSGMNQGGMNQDGMNQSGMNPAGQNGTGNQRFDNTTPSDRQGHSRQMESTMPDDDNISTY